MRRGAAGAAAERPSGAGAAPGAGAQGSGPPGEAGGAGAQGRGGVVFLGFWDFWGRSHGCGWETYFSTFAYCGWFP